MWLGEQITERGIGNGISLIIFAGIVVGLPARGPRHCSQQIRSGTHQRSSTLVFAARRSWSWSSRSSSSSSAPSGASRSSTPSASSGGKIYGGQTTYLPLRVNTAGVIPLIFASRSSSFPQYARAVRSRRRLDEARSATSARHGPAALQPALRRRRSSSSATSTRRSSSTRSTWPTTCTSTAASSRASARARRRPTTSTRVLTRITLVGALYLAVVAILPEFLITGVQGRRAIPGIGPWLDARLPTLRHPGLRLQLLLRRHVAADRRRRRDGHGPADRVAARHAPLRRLPEEGPHPRARA